MNLNVLTWRFYLLHIFFLNATLLSGQSTWTNPIIKQGYLGSPLVETSPFVFKNRLYLLENNQRFWDVPGAKPGDFFHQDEVLIRDVKSNGIISVALKNHAFATLLVWDGKTILYFTGSDQTTAGDLQWATYGGTPEQLFEYFYMPK